MNMCENVLGVGFLELEIALLLQALSCTLYSKIQYKP